MYLSRFNPSAIKVNQDTTHPGNKNKRKWCWSGMRKPVALLCRRGCYYTRTHDVSAPWTHLALNATQGHKLAIQQAIINQDTTHLTLNATQGHKLAIQQAIINQDTTHLALNLTQGHKHSFTVCSSDPILMYISDLVILTVPFETFFWSMVWRSMFKSDNLQCFFRQHNAQVTRNHRIKKNSVFPILNINYKTKI